MVSQTVTDFNLFNKTKNLRTSKMINRRELLSILPTLPLLAHRGNTEEPFPGFEFFERLGFDKPQKFKIGDRVKYSKNFCDGMFDGGTFDPEAYKNLLSIRGTVFWISPSEDIPEWRYHVHFDHETPSQAFHNIGDGFCSIDDLELA